VRLPVDQTFTVQVGDNSAFTYVAQPRDQIGNSLYWRGLDRGLEAETQRVFRTLAQEAEFILDVGANTGLYTLLACAVSPIAQVVSFEPVPRVYQILKQNVELNGWSARCDLRNQAVSNAMGLARLHVPLSNVPTSASLNPDGFRGNSGELIEVEATTIDAVCADRARVDLVKLDVEGFELEVLEGMERVLATDRPTIIMECIREGRYQATESLLARYGYRFYHLRDDGPIAVARLVPDIDERYRNFLCAVPDRWRAPS